ncbi:MAG: hypothetical protein IK059_05355, partial [Firmicutes bacterium]|nr:hypothetical protein [Bacillota bacterium]
IIKPESTNRMTPAIIKPEDSLKEKEKSEALENALAKIRDKFGRDSVGHLTTRDVEKTHH